MLIYNQKKMLSIGIIFLLLFMIAACSEKEKDKNILVTTMSVDAESEFSKGRDLFEKLRQQESLQFFENAIGKDKKFAMAYYYHSLANPTNKGFFEDLDNAVALTDNISELFSH